MAGAAMSTANQPSNSPEDTNATSIPRPVPLVMQIVVRRDLLAVRLRRDINRPSLTAAAQQDGWGVGPLMAQVAHATSAVGLNGSIWLAQT